MRHPLICSFALAVLLLPVTGRPVVAAEPDDEPAARILVTFEHGRTSKLAGKPVPGKNYRYRSRYELSAVVRKHIKALGDEFDMTPIDDWPIDSLQVYCVVYEPAQSVSLAALLDKLNLDPRVESAQEMKHFESMALAETQYNDAYVEFQHALASMNVSQAHKFANGKGVTIAVIDSGVDLRHEDLLASRIRARNFVSASRRSTSTAHGTAVVSLIVANPNNGKGIVGIAPAAELTSLRACWTTGNSETARCDSFTLAKALDYAVRSPPDLINLSISGPRDPLLGRLIDKALQNGTVIVAAQPDLASPKNAYPAGFEGVLAVGAASATQEKSISHATPGTAILAPGEQIMVALPDDAYDFRSGSSLAAANASGVIALLLERAPELDGARVAEILRSSQSVSEQGHRVIDACRALAEIDSAYVCQ